VLTLELASDKPVAHLIARLCDVRPGGESLRVSFGVLNLTHHASHAEPRPLVPGERIRVRLRLNDAGAVFPAGHRLRLALSTTYWPMVWPAPEPATLTILGGSLYVPVRDGRAEDAAIAFAPVETAPPDRPTPVRPGVVRWERMGGLEVGSDYWRWREDLGNDDPTSAVVEMRRSGTVARGAWRTKVETFMRMSSTREAFRLEASVRAFEGDAEVCSRLFDRTIKRDLL
jgi:hypothetical protein